MKENWFHLVLISNHSSAADPDQNHQVLITNLEIKQKSYASSQFGCFKPEIIL
jgi:hypothetical protein